MLVKIEPNRNEDPYVWRIVRRHDELVAMIHFDGKISVIEAHAPIAPWEQETIQNFAAEHEEQFKRLP